MIQTIPLAIFILILSFLTGCYSVPHPKSLTDQEEEQIRLQTQRFQQIKAEWLKTYQDSHPNAQKQAQELWEQMKTCAKISPEAKYYLAWHILKKESPTPEEEKQAIQYLEEAVEQGYPSAMTLLGVLYLQGKGVFQSSAKAFRLFSLAAQHNDRDAMYNLGLLYATGYGFSQNDEDAIYWLTKADPEKKDPLCSWWLGKIYLRRANNPDDLILARKYIRHAAEKQIREAVFLYAVLLERGIGGPANPVEAEHWFSVFENFEKKATTQTSSYSEETESHHASINEQDEQNFEAELLEMIITIELETISRETANEIRNTTLTLPSVAPQ